SVQTRLRRCAKQKRYNAHLARTPKDIQEKMMSDTDKMISRKDGRVGYVIYNNPERHNAVSLDMWEAAVGILDNFRDDKDINVVVVTGAGGKAFVSGADISKFEKERS